MRQVRATAVPVLRRYFDGPYRLGAVQRVLAGPVCSYEGEKLMSNKIDRLEAEMESIEEALDLAVTGRSFLHRAAGRFAWDARDTRDLWRAIDLSVLPPHRLYQWRKEVAAVLERERVRADAEEARGAKREQARAKRVERRRERVERNIRVAWGEVRLGPDDWAVLWPSIVREAIMIDRAYCPDAWR